MKRSIVSGLAGLLVLLCASAAQAHPSSGASCGGCHSAVTGKETVPSPLTTNLTDNTGVPAGLKLFKVQAGGTISLPISILNAGTSGDFYAVEFKGLASATTDTGILNAANIMTFLQDPTWTARGSGTSSYATRGAFAWSGTQTDYSYLMKVNAGAAPDYYLLSMAVAGLDTNGTWTQEQNIVVQVTAVPEPASLSFLGMTLGALVLRRRRAAGSLA